MGTAEMLSFYVSSLGVSASQSIPVIIGGSVVFDVILGVSFLNKFRFESDARRSCHRSRY